MTFYVRNGIDELYLFILPIFFTILYSFCLFE